jgi:hypothetical protein
MRRPIISHLEGGVSAYRTKSSRRCSLIDAADFSEPTYEFINDCVFDDLSGRRTPHFQTDGGAHDAAARAAEVTAL